MESTFDVSGEPTAKFYVPVRESDLQKTESSSEEDNMDAGIGSDNGDTLLSDVKSEEDPNGVEVASNEPKSSKFPPTYLVLKLSPNIQPAAVSWLAKKITSKRHDGGAELQLRSEPFRGKKKEGLVLHISASKLKFLETAELIELKKTDVHGVMREFTVSDLDNFLHDGIRIENLLSVAEKQQIVLHELENIRAQFDEHSVPGYPNITLFPGQSVFQVYVQEGLITTYYPLHDAQELEQLGVKWYWALFQAQPFEEIRRYFGEAIALYFSFLGFYTTSLFVPAIFGILHMFLPESASSTSIVFFCVFNLIWVTIFLEAWKRKCSGLAYSWGTLRMTKWEEPRANYRGTPSVDPVTGRYTAKYPWWKTSLKAYCVSLPIVLTCLFGAFYIMLYSFWAEEAVIEAKQRYGSKMAGMFVMLPSIVYAALVHFMNLYYRQLANFLTEWENHRTQAQFERHRVTKLVLFEFVNNFMSLFYIAFYIQDFDMLKSQVTVMLIIQQGLNHFQEALLPLVIKKGYHRMQEIAKAKYPQKFNLIGAAAAITPLKASTLSLISSTSSGSLESQTSDASIWDPVSLGMKVLDPADPRLQKSRTEGEMDPYEGTFDDYLEMFIQFGYVFLFSSVYPLAAFWAIFNNILEIRADAFKLCKVYQRPIPKKVKDIGAWQVAFEIMGGIAVMTNCALLCLSPNLRTYAPMMRPVEWLLLFVIIEHFVLASKLALRSLIPDTPAWVKIEMARLEYQSRQALKHEQSRNARRQLTRRFKSFQIKTKKPRSLRIKQDVAESTAPGAVRRKRVTMAEAVSTTAD